VVGIDAIFGGHTHDGMPKPIEVKNADGVTVVTNAGCSGKYRVVAHRTAACFNHIFIVFSLTHLVNI
jgi:2',3'-cyclic-nucleotide 2'-phosphodiesterase (5'-nucleotidase family)